MLKKRVLSNAIVILLLIASGLTVLASSGWTPQGISETQTPLTAHTLDATPDHYWIGTTTDTSVTTNWQPASVPGTGDNIYFSALSVGNCAWGLTGSYGSFNLLANFTRTVTQAASFSVTSYAQTAGSFTGSISYVLTDNGAFSFSTSGTLGANTRLTMAGNGYTCTLPNVLIYDFVALDNTTIAFAGGDYAGVTHIFTTTAGKTLTINPSVTGFAIFNQHLVITTLRGAINGAGALRFGEANASVGTLPDFTQVTITCSVWIECWLAYETLTLSGNMNLGGPLLFVPNTATIITLDLSANNYALSATSITIPAKSVLNGRGSTITCAGWDSSAGTFMQGTSSVHLTGTTKTLKTTGTSTFNKLFLDAGSSYTLQSNVITQQYWKNGTLALGGHTLYVDQDQAPSITSTPSTTTFACNQQYAYTYAGSDREGENLTYALTTNLSGLTLSAGNSTIWRHGAQHARGTFTMHLSVTDGNHTVWQNTSLTLTNLVPYFTSTPIVTKAFDLDYSYDANATDPEGYITYGLSSSLGGLTVNSTTGVVSKAHYLGNGTFLVNVSASDGNYTVWQNYTLTLLNQVPIVTSRPRMSVIIYDSYSYIPDGYDPEGLSLVINVTTSAPWLTFNPNGTLSGSPLSRDAGSWLINVSFWDGYRTTYDNYTIEVSVLDAATTSILTFILGLIFCFAFLFLGLRNPVFMMLAGIVWILVSLSIFITYGPLFLLVGLGVGFIGMIEGGLRYGS